MIAEGTWYQVEWLNNALWRWGALLAAILGALVLGKALSFFLGRQARRLRERERWRVFELVLRAVERPVMVLVLAGGLYLVAAWRILNLEFEAATFQAGVLWMQVTRALVIFAVGWMVYRLVDVVEHFLLRWTSRTRTKLDDQLVPLIRKSLRVFVVIVVLLFVADNVFRWDIGALVAGLGIGGLAFALAAKDALANLFGSVTIFADRPFQMGDWVRILGHEGVVEEVGFRSTRLRTFYGHLITLPNASVANAEIDNVSRRPFIRRNLSVTVTYDTPPEKLQEGLDILRDMCEARAEHWAAGHPPRIFFSDFNAASLGLYVAYWYTPPDYWRAQQFHNDFNLELLRRFNEAGIEFAFPTQTIYMKRDGSEAEPPGAPAGSGRA